MNLKGVEGGRVGQMQGNIPLKHHQSSYHKLACMEQNKVQLQSERSNRKEEHIEKS